MALKSFSIKIGADTSGFNKGLKEANKAIKSTIKEGKALKESLKLEYSTQGFEATQRTYQHALDLTNQKAQALKDQLAYLEQNNGVDTDAYYDLQTNLAKTNIEAKNLTKTLEELKNIKIETLSNQFDSVGNKISSVGKTASIFSAAAAAALAGSYKLADSARKTGDEIGTLASQYDMSAVSIQKWNYIALQTDVSAERLYKGMVKVRDAVGTAIAGESNNATEAIDKLLGGIGNLSTDSEQAFKQIVEALGQVENSSLQAYYADEIFGNNIANELIPLVKQGSGVIQELSEEFETLGYLTNGQVKELSELDNRMNALTTKLTNVKTQLGMALVPIMEYLANLLETKIAPAIQRVSNWFNSLSEEQKKLVTNILLLVAAAGPLILLIGKMTSGVGGLIKSLSGLSSLLTVLEAHPIIAAIAIVIVLLATLYAKNEEFRNSVNALFKTLQPLFSLVASFASGALKAIANNLSMILDMLGPILTFIVKDLNVGLSNLMVMLIPIAYILEFIMKTLQATIQLTKDLVSFNWFGIGENQNKIWSNWETNKFAKAATGNMINAYKDLFSNTSSTGSNMNYESPSDYSTTNNNTTYDNSTVNTYQNTITIEANEYTTPEDIVDIISKKLAIKVQSRS